jgi:tripartite-type tricarboxylate transporter receptor subunit TctC
MTTRREFATWVAASASGLATSTSSFGQSTMPKGPITLVVPFAAGGATDVVSRHIAKKITDKTGVPIIVENVAGGGGVVGAAKVVRGNKDGTVLLMGTVATHAINPLARTTPLYDAIRDFTPISLVAIVPNVLLVNPNVKAQNLKELIALLKAAPGKYSYGTSGIGTPPHLSGELFKSMSGVDMAHVPYRGGGPAMTDLISGQIPILFDVLTGAASHIRNGTVRAIGVTTATRSTSFPNVPTITEAGLSGYETYTWNAVFGPAGMSQGVVESLSKEFQKAVAEPDIQEKLRELSANPVGTNPEALTTHVKSELKKWGAVIKSIDLKLE